MTACDVAQLIFLIFLKTVIHLLFDGHGIYGTLIWCVFKTKNKIFDTLSQSSKMDNILFSWSFLTFRTCSRVVFLPLELSSLCRFNAQLFISIGRVASAAIFIEHRCKLC